MSRIRIIGGKHRGKRLFAPADRMVRPTAERAREALFSILQHAGPDPGGRFADARVLDLFCGTGAVGLEAFSRGAGEVWLIDRDIALARRNAEALGRPDAVHCRQMDATRLGRAPCRFDLVFMDPPYGSGLAEPALLSLASGWLAPGALVIVELAAKETFEPPTGFQLEDDRRYGAARLVFLELSGH